MANDAKLIDCQFRCLANNEIVAVNAPNLYFDSALFPQETILSVEFECPSCWQKHYVRLDQHD